MAKVRIERLSGGTWAATICWLHGSMKIFADTREDVIRKSSHFAPDTTSTVESVFDSPLTQL
jgi:hypothetical protein